MGTTLSSDSKLRFTDNAPVNGTVLKQDSLIKYVDANSNGHWDPGEPVVYDTNNDGIYESIKPIIAGSVSIGTQLRSDPLIKYVDINTNNHWDPGEAVVYDTNNNGLYTSGKPVIAGNPINPGTSLTLDSHVKFIGSGTTWAAGNTVVYDSNKDNQYSASSDPHLKYVDLNSNGHWDSGEPIIYDVNLTGTFQTGDPVLYGSAPGPGTSLKTDAKILFVDSNRNGVWNTGEAVVYDSDSNYVVDSVDTIIVPANPPLGVSLSSDIKIKYVDSNSNNVWDQGETVVYDSVGMGYYNATIDPKIEFYDINNTGQPFHTGDPVIYDKFGTGTYQTGDTVIQSYGKDISLICATGDCLLTLDHHFHFVDTTLTGHWLNGDTVIYDSDSDHIYMTGDPVITGTPPASGTPLVEPVISGPTPIVGTALKSDPKITFLRTNGMVTWSPGEAVIYDSNNDGIYDNTPAPADIVIVGTLPSTGTLLSEPVIAGPMPTIGTALKSDPKLKIVDAAKTGLWNPGQITVYDSGGSGFYVRGDPVIADASPGDGSFHLGEVVAYDSNSDSIFETGEPVPYGSAPVNGTSLASDPRVKYIDTNSNGHWVSGDTIAYDTNNNGVYDQGDLIITGTAPPSSIFLAPSTALDNQGRLWLSWDEKVAGSGVDTTVSFKTGNGTTWSAKQMVTTGTNPDTDSFATPLVNSTMMILWSSNRSSSGQIFYRLYSTSGTSPFPASNPVQLTFTSLYDHSPSAVQDRNGRIWVAWTRANAQGTTSQIYYKYFNGTAWSTDFALPPAVLSRPYEVSPDITETKDGRIVIVWASNATSNSNLNIFYATTNDTMTSLPTNGIPTSSWSSAIQFPFGNTSDEDDHPSFLQSQDGSYWVFFQRSITSPAAEYVLYSTATSLTGSAWSGASQMSSGTDSYPSAVQNSDHYVWVFYNSVLTSGFGIVYEKTTTQYVGNDLGVRALTAPSFIRSYYPVNLTSLVQNSGNSLESATLTLTANSTTLNTWTVSLAPGKTQTYYYNWTNAPWGRYTILTALSNISPANSPNNLDTSVEFFMRISPPGDANGDGVVNIQDLALIAFCWQQVPVQGTLCNGYVDVNRDGVINIQDLATAAFYYTKTVYP